MQKPANAAGAPKQPNVVKMKFGPGDYDIVNPDINSPTLALDQPRRNKFKQQDMADSADRVASRAVSNRI